MRHLRTAELLLYAEGELDERELCRHVSDCVDCKARLVDLQETYVHAASAIRARTRGVGAQPAQLQRLRSRLAVEAELLAAHLGTEELLLSVEDGLSVDRRAHLSSCTACQDRAADIHLQLAEIECELHRQLAFELPAERRAAALAALRERLAQEVVRQSAVAAPTRRWLPSIRLPQAPAFASYATAFATACLVAWIGWNSIPEPETPIAAPRASLVTPEAAPVAPSAPVEVAAASSESLPPQVPERFVLTATAPSAPLIPIVFLALPAPEPELPAFQPLRATFALQDGMQPPIPPLDTRIWAARAAPLAAPLPERAGAPATGAPEAVIEGSWMLAKTGLWKEALRAGGTREQIRFTGALATDQARQQAERKLLAAADGWPVSFSIAVRTAWTGSGTTPPQAASAGEQPSGGLARNSLLQHYADAARRSFQPLDQGRLDDELDRYVSGVMRDNSELLAHAHALHSVLNSPGIDRQRSLESLRRVIDFHLNGIARHEKGIHNRLSEALPRRDWAHRGPKEDFADADKLGAVSRDLLVDALALDRTLTTMFFGASETLDVRARNLSSADLLARIRKHARRLRVSLQ